MSEDAELAASKARVRQIHGDYCLYVVMYGTLNEGYRAFEGADS
jgi:hypothetical protein